MSRPLVAAAPPALDDAKGRARPQLENSVFVACGLALGSGLIHVDAAVEHFHEYALFAVFFVVVACLQFAWAVGAYRRPTRALLRAGAYGSLLVVALWVVSRTSGLPLGPERWEPESVGGFDAIATADEIALALLVLAPAGFRGGRVGRWVAKEGALGVGLLLILLSSLALVSGAHAH
jgi:hypothetical protein